ncbi:hypothetical protein Tco_0206010 [Tanacetum coccineum]
MDTTRAQQQALDDELVALADRLKIGKNNLRLSSILKSKEPTLQVALDALKLTPFYNAFEISADVPEIYMQEFWVIISRHHSSLRFKLNGKSHIVNVDNFRDMHLGHSGDIKFLSDVNVNHMHQPWRSFVAIINKCLSGKTTTLESLRLSRAQILWGMYHNKTVDYVYLLWEDLVYQVENKNSKKKNDMDDFMFTTIRVISKHQDTQVYGAILPQHLTNQAMLESEAYMTYHAYATGEKTPKPKSTKKKANSESSPKTKLTQASKGKRIKTITKGDKPTKKKQSVTKSKGLTVLSKVALTEAEKIKLATKRSLIKTHSSHASSSGADEGTRSIPGVPDVPTYKSNDEQISWKSSEEKDDNEVNVSKDNDDDADNDNDVDKDDEDDDADNQDDEILDDANQDDDDEQTDSDNDGDDFVYLKLTTHNDEARQDDEVNEEGSDEESNEDSDEEVQSANTEEVEMDKEATHEEDEANELYRDVNINLEGRDTVMTDAPLPNVQGTQVTEDTHVIITAPINPEGIDTIFTPNTEATSLVDVPVAIIAKPPLLSATTLPPTPLITNLQQTPFKETNQFADAVSSILGIVDVYLAKKMYETVKTAVQLQSERLRDEAQTKNVDFLNKLDDNIKKIIKDQVKEQVKAQVSKILPKIEKTVNEQHKAEVMTHSSTESKTSLATAANLSELELKKILIDKMESNKSIHRSNEQKNLYKALVDAYESDKLILDIYGDTVSFKRHRDDEDKYEEPSAGSNWGSKRRQSGKEPESTSAPKEKTSKTSGNSYEGPAKLPTPDRDWNKTFSHAHGPVQPWLSSLAQIEDPRELFNELMDTPLDFSAFVMNRLKVDTLTLELLTGLTFELMKGSCKSLVELKYLFEEVYKATTKQLDWNNPKGQKYPHDLRKPLPLIPNSRGRHVIPFDHFINNDLEYLSDGVSSRKYATSVTKTKAVNYGHVKWIEDLVPNRIFAANRESARDVYSKRRIVAVTKLEIVNWHNYKHLDWITVRRDDDKLYKFKEGDFNRLHIQDIEDMLLLLV